MSTIDLFVEAQTALRMLAKFENTDSMERRVTAAASGLLLDRNRKRFLAETNPEGQKWKPSKAGLARRAMGDTGTLFDTGRLFHSIAARAGAGTGVFVGTSGVPYARKHQEGAGVVKRVFLGVGGSDLEDVRRTVVAVIEDEINSE